MLNNLRENAFKCIGCAACSGVCPRNAITVKEVSRRGFNPVVNNLICTDCGACKDVCPTQEICLPEHFPKNLAVYTARSMRTDIFFKSSSGGGVSSLLISMFNHNLIDAALVVFYDKKLNLYGDFITSSSDVLNHAGSYYQPSKQLCNIKKIRKFNSVAIVGLPCHIEALKRFAKSKNLENIYVTISIFCTIGRMRKGLIDFFKYELNYDLDSLEFSDYKSRGGTARFSDIKLRTIDNKNIAYSCKKYLGFVDFFYTPEGCFYCRKIFGLNADISVGDDNGENGRNRKYCLISINSERGQEVFSQCDLLTYMKADYPVQTLLNSQPFGVPLKIANYPLKIPIMKILKKIGYLNKIPQLRKIVGTFKYIIILALIKLSRG